MPIVYKKTRPEQYRYELENEFRRLEVAKKSFRHIMTPQNFWFENLTLATEAVGAGASIAYKRKYTAEHFVQEYTNILRKLWDEKLNTNEDLTPEWVANPIWKQKTNLHPDFQQKNKSELETILMNGKKYVKCKKTVVHGDLCPMNIIFDNDGHAAGLIDLGDLHMGNKMLDIAVLSWTIRGNFGKKYEESFLQNIGVEPDDEELEYYRLIYDLSLPDYKNWNWIKKEEK